jgi:hypothetical protein
MTMSTKTVFGCLPCEEESTAWVRDVSFSDPHRQEIFTHLSEAFGRRPMESLRSAAERVVGKGYADDEPVLKAARVVLDLDRRRALTPAVGLARSVAAWEGLAEARSHLMEPES